MVTGYQRTEFRSWATGPCTGTSSWDSCVWGSGYFGGFREMKGSIISFHFTLCTFLFKIITTELAVTSRKRLLWNNFIAICLTWWMMRDTILFLSLKKIITLLLIIISYAWVIQDILGAAFCVNILKTLKLPNLKVSLRKNSFHSVMLLNVLL